ncbi:MAG TPA: helix-turn-helix transcriptional regulator [Candidatus Paceibacterota bacterium]|nr:helix-turn-helix transcriptional regulator [Candidatus Paceibacterota bacterium]
MRVSSQSHTLAVLRILLGLTQKEMAAVLQCSAPTIQAIELDRLKLSEKLAGLASLKTGINLAWLLENDVTQPPIDTKGRAYTKATFEEFQAINNIRKDPQMENEIAIFCRNQISVRLHALLLRAYRNDATDLCVYKLSKAFDELEKQFGVTNDDRKAIKPVKRAPKFEAEVKKDERLTWWEFASRFFDVLDQEERKKIAARRLKPMSDTERKKRDIEAVYLDDAGQVAVKQFSAPLPNNPNLDFKKKK